MNKETRDIITVRNNGPLIVRTNFWRTATCRTGLPFLCWNAGTARLLLPATLEHCLLDMAAAKHVIISLCSATNSRNEVLEIIFEDLSGMPLTLVIGTDQAGGIPAESTLESFPLTVWTKEGLEQSHSAEFRRAN